MDRLELLPEKNGYSVKDQLATKSTRQSGPLSFFARYDIYGNRVISGTWKLTAAEYASFFAFYNTHKSLPFLMFAILDNADLQDCTCRFRTYNLSAVEGLTYTVQATLTVVPNA